MQALLDHAWPGNVRELDHVDRARRADGARATQVRARGSRAARRRSAAPPRLEDMSLEDVERVLIKKALDRA